MKKNTILMVSAIIFIIFIAQSSLFAQRYGVTSFKMGYFNPKDTKGGLIFGGYLGTAFDESVDIGLGLDFFRGTNKEEREIENSSTAGVIETGWIPEEESSVTFIPITGQVNVKIPATYQLFYTAGAGFGYGLMWAKEAKYEDGEKVQSKSKFYHGFRWMLSGGILYKIGSRSALTIEAFYDRAKLDREEDNITYKVNVSGFGIRAGIRLGIL
ncbi:hypothetical protein GF337_12920 [candidate division KSB1 bacterium]|nr:hypothetical protein [candidate division KSB1 bacterium]